MGSYAGDFIFLRGLLARATPDAAYKPLSLSPLTIFGASLCASISPLRSACQVPRLAIRLLAGFKLIVAARLIRNRLSIDR